jgi:N-acyl-D-aspartate/D-glutamate deacylase
MLAAPRSRFARSRPISPRWLLVIWSPLLLCAGTESASAEFAYDLALRGGTLYAGGLEMAGRGDVAIRQDRIVAVGEAVGSARREIDATGLVVAPGFIDLHNHTDEIYHLAGWLPLPRSMHANLNFLFQGVTTIATGNCGSGFADPEAVREWLARIDALPFGSNVIHLIPHGQLRLQVMGEAQADRADPRPTPDEMERLKELLDAGMRAGAWGLSTGLEYDPGARAETKELVELTRVVALRDGIYASHTRHEGPVPEKMLASYGEVVEIGARAGARVHISHLKLAGQRVHGMANQVIELIETARERGVRITADQYPYPAGSTTLTMPVPPEMRDGSRVLPRYCERAGSAELRAGVAFFLAEETPPAGLLVSLYPWKWWLQGKTVAEIAAERGVDPVEVTMDLACGWPGTGIYFSQSERDVREFMRRPWVATASDGGAIFAPLGRWVHPRLYGTFPRKIRRYVYDEELIALPFALRSMTELPAEIFQIPERGRLTPGYYADVVAFHPERLRDVATFEESGRYSEGVEYLLVTGVLTDETGEYTGHRARGGRALRLALRDHRDPLE